MWVSQTTVDGLDVTIGLAKILAGHWIYLQDRDDASKWVKYNVTADGVDSGSYWTYTVTYNSGPGGIPVGQVEFQPVAPGTAGVPPGGTTSQALIKSSGTDYAVSWGGPYQPVDADLTTIAGLTATTDNFMVAASSAWASRTPAQAKTSLALVKGDVGLGNVDNTSDATKEAATSTLTNKRITKRTGTTTSTATPSINSDTTDFYSITALAVNITSVTVTGTPTEGQTLWIAITGTAARTIAWGSSFEASTVALPTTTVTTARLDVGFIWNTVTSKWRCVAVV